MRSTKNIKSAKKSSKTATVSGKKAGSSRKPAGRDAAKFSCPNTGRKYSLEDLVREMAGDQDLADFIRQLLRRGHAGDEEALDCLDSYCKLSDSDLKKLQIPRQQWADLKAGCTERTNKLFLIDVPAYVTAKGPGKS